jgi:hypothetical protein
MFVSILTNTINKMKKIYFLLLNTTLVINAQNKDQQNVSKQVAKLHKAIFIIKLPPAKQVDLWLKAKFQSRSQSPVGYSPLYVLLLPDISHTFLSYAHLFLPYLQNIP